MVTDVGVDIAVASGSVVSVRAVVATDRST
jgi:hypothetical protein